MCKFKLIMNVSRNIVGQLVMAANVLLLVLPAPASSHPAANRAMLSAGAAPATENRINAPIPWAELGAKATTQCTFHALPQFLQNPRFVGNSYTHNQNHEN